MTRYKEFEASTEAEALETASREFGVPATKLSYSVLSYGSSGIFGLVGVKKARIRVGVPQKAAQAQTEKPQAEEAAPAKQAQKPQQKGKKPASAEKKPRSRQQTAEPGAPKKQPGQKPSAAPADNIPPRPLRPARKKSGLADLPELDAEDLNPEAINLPDAPASQLQVEPMVSGEALEPKMPVEALEETESRPAAPPKKSRRTRTDKRKKRPAPNRQHSAKGKETPAPDIDPEKDIDEDELENSGPGEPGQAEALLTPEEIEADADMACKILGRLAGFVSADFSCSVGSASANQVTLIVTGPEAGILIGRRGQTLESLQYLIEMIVNRNRKARLRVQVDVDGYIARHEDNLRQQALKMAARVKATGKQAAFAPMNAHDRRIVHLLIKEDSELKTFSKGSGALRKLVILPKNAAERKAKSPRPRTRRKPKEAGSPME
ncbi:MAG: RNA-binding cell elongation regulator Jag/EloR [Desulfatibacillaceae bacterium]|nr:RNA-binding cell elongation regulator Jag/EloR [Desulfatibacillaceae bacterium]